MSREFVWAVDPALSRHAFAFAPTDGGQVQVETLITASDARDGERLGQLDRQLRIFARQRTGEYPPAVVWVAQASGRFPNPQLAYAVGIVQCALFASLGCPVWTIPSGTWKKRTAGVGNATKAQVAAWVERQGVDVASQDEADAVAIAYAGRAMLLARSWEAAA